MNTLNRKHIRTGTSPTPFTSRLALSQRRGGSVIFVAMIMVVIVTTLVGVTFLATNAASRMGDRATDYIATQRAAEAAVEYGYGIWKRRIFVANGAITTAAASANLNAPSLAGFAYASTAGNGPLTISATDEFGAPTAAPTRVPVSLLDYPGWRGYAAGYLVSAKINSVGQLGSTETAGVRRRFQYVEVPLFQMMFFFQDSLEFYKPANMIIGGLVHTNANLYASSVSGLTFSGNVSYVGTYTDSAAPPYATLWNPWGGDQPPTFPNGKASQLTQVAAAQPMGVSLTSFFSAADANPNNDGYREIIEQPVAGFTDPPEIAARRMFNKAGIVLTINGTTATVTTQNGTVIPPAQLAQMQAAFTGKTTLYDQREGKTADVANINVSKLTQIIDTGGVTGFNGVMYIVDATPVTTSGTTPSPNQKTIRLQNGGILPDGGLTIASQNPVYIQGDYNTGTNTSGSGTSVPPSSVPANATGNPSNTDSPTVSGYTRKASAVMGDAVTFLSNAWNDSNASSTLGSRDASNTTYNTAVMAGFMPSGYQPASGSQYGYSGGGNNFPRFLENWSGNACTYHGSMVELFTSKTYTGKWDTGNIYSPPNRRWNFDTNFATKAPPGGLNSVVYTRGSWSKF